MNRRTFLQGATLSLGVPVVGAVATRFGAMHGGTWSPVSTPTSNTLHAAVRTAGGPVAAGSNGVLLTRTDGDWNHRLRNGPGGNGNNLTTLGVTADGNQLWMAGASGALGAYDVRDGELTDRTAPDGVTNTITALAVTGSAGDANVYLADAAGQVHVSFDNGAPGSWTHHTPGSGATIHGLDCYDTNSGILVDGNQAVFETTTGTDWQRIGIEDADESLYALDADGANDCRIVGGRIYSRTADEWNARDVTDETLNDVAVCPCGGVHAVGAGGAILHRPGRGRGDEEDGGEWQIRSPTGKNLHGIALGHPHVAVGAAGTILERDDSASS